MVIGLAKLKCKLVSIYASDTEVAAVMKRLQEMSVIDIDTAASDEETSVLHEGYFRTDTSDKINAYERNAETAESAVKILNLRFPEKKGIAGLFNSARELTPEEFYLKREQIENALSLANEVIENDRKIAEQKAEIVRLNTTREQMLPWEPLDVPLSFSGTVKTRAFIGTVAGIYTLDGLCEKIAELDPEIPLYTEIVNTGKDITYIFACCPKEQAERAEAVLRALSFARPAQITSKLPRDKIASKEQRADICKEKIEKSLERIKEISESRYDIENLADYCRGRAENFRAAGEIARTSHTVLIKGYVAERDIPYLEKELKKQFTVVLEAEDANEELAPVQLQNNAFARPAETLVKMYSLPGSRDIDPSPITGFFYYLFFGMMFSDAGYGLIMIIATTLALAKFKLSRSMRQNMRLFQYCGISTFLWGLVYGSFFGDSIAVISERFFGHKVALPALIDPMNGDAVTLLILSLALGLVEIIAGLCAKFATCIKNGDKAGAFFDAGLWITTLTGIALMALGFVTVPIIKNIGIGLALLSVVGLILTQGRDKKNPIMRLFSGIASLYDITSYVSDLLSFSRLMALGLTTSAMSAVFNMLSAMGGKSVGGFILLIIVFPLGHAINFGLNVLGAYVHTLRLQYVELFSKFYEGGGREFKPFSFKSKYTDLNVQNIKEEN